MARIPAAEIERLKSEVSVEHLVAGAGIALRRAGRDLMGVCALRRAGAIPNSRCILAG